MKKILNDPLLTVARIGTIVVQVFLIIGQIALGIAMAATVIGALGYLPDGVEFAGIGQLPRTGMWLAALTILLILISLGLSNDFVVRLRQIIDTVGQGDPFVTDNADRLDRMAWIAVAVQIITIVASIVAEWTIARVGEDVMDLKTNVTLSALGLAVILFILARVFRKGAEMRAELEGTV